MQSIAVLVLQQAINCILNFSFLMLLFLLRFVIFLAVHILTIHEIQLLFDGLLLLNFFLFLFLLQVNLNPCISYFVIAVNLIESL